VISVIFGPGPALYHWTVQYNGTTRPTRVPIGPCLGLRVGTPGKPGMTRRLPVSCRAGPGSTFGHLYTNLKTKKLPMLSPLVSKSRTTGGRTSRVQSLRGGATATARKRHTWITGMGKRHVLSDKGRLSRGLDTVWRSGPCSVASPKKCVVHVTGGTSIHYRRKYFR
jgi:hypothetical protein